MDMTREQRIEEYAGGYERLGQALRELPREMWGFRPAPDEWTIHEVVVHLADSEADAYVQCREVVAEPGRVVAYFNQDKWWRSLNYEGQDVDETLDLIRLLRRANLTLLRSAPDDVWQNQIEIVNVRPMSLEFWLRTYNRHLSEHINQLRANHEAWSRTRM
jgi:hypothetical protein